MWLFKSDTIEKWHGTIKAVHPHQDSTTKDFNCLLRNYHLSYNRVDLAIGGLGFHLSTLFTALAASALDTKWPIKLLNS